MKKAVSILLTIAMCLGMLVAIVPTVSATEPEITPSGAVYYEENFNDPSYATLVDSDLAAAIGWSAPNAYQTMLIQDGKLRIVAQATANGLGTGSWANDQAYTVVKDERIAQGITVIESKFTYQARPAGSSDVVVTPEGGETKTIKADGQCGQHYASFRSKGDADNYWQATPFRVSGAWGTNTACLLRLNGAWAADTYYDTNGTYGDLRDTQGGPIHVTNASYPYEFMGNAGDGGATWNSIMGEENSVKIVIDPGESAVSVWINGSRICSIKDSQKTAWTSELASKVITDTIGFYVKPGMDVLIDDVKIYAPTAVYRGYQTSDVTDGKYSVRFVATIDDLADLNSVGFKIRAQYTKDATPVDNTVTQYCAYVYTSILAAGEPVSAASLGGNYIFALHIDNIPTDVGEITFTVTPYYRHAARGLVEGVAQTVVVGS